MRLGSLTSLLLGAGAAQAALNLPQINPSFAGLQNLNSRDFSSASQQSRRQTPPQSRFLTDKTSKFVVNGTGLPEIPFDVGESYAGQLSISDNVDDPNKLFFWFFPSTNPAAEQNKEILLWVTGGPGCSSTGELLQENGPFLWTPGTFSPIPNDFSWHHLTNVVWIDQPIGAGFSRGNVTARSEEDVAAQFLGFWRNFMTTFAMEGYKVYVTGSSYSGMYCPYIASAMLDAHESEGAANTANSVFDVAGMLVFDGLFSDPSLAQDVPVTSFVLENWGDTVFSFNDSFRSALSGQAQQCGFDNYLTDHLVFPPTAVQPVLNTSAECSIFFTVFVAAAEANPCFSPYRISAACPLPFDPLGFAAGYEFVPPGFGPVYLNRPDVKKAINAPVDDIDWVFCNAQPVFVNGTDESVLAGPGSQPVLPGVIDRTKNVIIGHGAQDFVLQAAGTLLTIQNLTWGGQLGFRTAPAEALFVPSSGPPPALLNTPLLNTTLSGSGVMGTAHSERGLTYIAVAGSGHFVSQDTPGVSFRAIEVLLGRVESFQSTLPFTAVGGVIAGGGDGAAVTPPEQLVDLGNGTVIDGWIMGSLAAAVRSDGGKVLAAFENTGDLGSPQTLAVNEGARTAPGGIFWGVMILATVGYLF